MLNKNILIKRLGLETKTAGGLDRPIQNNLYYAKGQVIDVSKDATPSVQAGDTILFKTRSRVLADMGLDLGIEGQVDIIDDSGLICQL